MVVSCTIDILTDVYIGSFERTAGCARTQPGGSGQGKEESGSTSCIDRAFGGREKRLLEGIAEKRKREYRCLNRRYG